MGGTHYLMFNKFNVLDYHLLLITKHYEPQTTKLTTSDLDYAAFTFSALRGVMFFNGGKKAGASQHHKHLQILPSHVRTLPIFSKVYK